MFFGAFISLIVDSALFEIGKSPFFATVFGICLFVIGGLILWRVAPEQVCLNLFFFLFLIFLFSPPCCLSLDQRGSCSVARGCPGVSSPVECVFVCVCVCVCV